MYPTVVPASAANADRCAGLSESKNCSKSVDMRDVLYQNGNSRQAISLPLRCIYRNGNGWSDAGTVKSIYQTRRENLAELIRESFDGKQARFADAMEFEPSFVSRLLSTTSSAKNIGNNLARQIERKGSKPEHWLDVDHTTMREGRASYNVDAGPEIRGRVPLISWVQAGNFNTVVDNHQVGQADEWIETTVPIRRHTFALRVKGDSMRNPSGDEPTFPDGSVIVCEPDAVSDLDSMVRSLVIVKRTRDDEATFKQLVKDAGASTCGR
jgi:SOS-response transcriptional repressor LexA